MILAAIAEVMVDPPAPQPTVAAAGLLPGERTEPISRQARSATVAAASIIPARWRAFATCIVARESHGNPRARNPRSSAQGIAQWLDRSWRYGLAHDVAVRLHAFGMPWEQALGLRAWLRGHEIATWPLALQQVGLAAVLEAGGWRHWYLAGSRCNGLAVGS